MLSTQDLQNTASYSANSVSVGLGTGTPSPGASLSAGLSGVGIGSDKGSASSRLNMPRFNSSGQSHFANHLDFRTDIAFVQNIFLDLVDDRLEGIGLAHFEHALHTQELIFHLG